MSTLNTVKKSQQDEITLPHKPVVLIKRSLIHQIQYLHSKYPNKEWSGPLIYKIDGDINDPSEIKIECEDLYPCDLGEAASTDFDFADHVEDTLEIFPSLMSKDRCRGLIHTHELVVAYN